MKFYRNIMEILVEDFYESVKNYDGYCSCERCRNDVIAYALNQLPAQYAVTDFGASMVKANNLHRQYYADIQTAVARGMKIVAESPRHDETLIRFRDDE